VLVALMGLALSAPPCFAAEPAVAPQAKLNLRAAVAKLATPDTKASARLSQEPTKDAATSSENRSFIHSTKGVAAVLLLAGGLTWAIASRSKDALHSPGRN
jgi:hypothetical protein